MKKNVDQAWLEEPWFDALKPQQKLAWFYVWTKSDLVGVWSGNFKVANMQIGYEIKWEEFKTALGKRVKIIADGKWWLTEYCPFQFGTFSPESRVHMAAKRELNKHGVSDEESNWIAYPIGYPEATRSLIVNSHSHSLERGKGSAEGKRENPPEIPQALDTPEFREAWESYVQFRRAAKFKPLPPISVRSRFKELAEWGLPVALKAIETAIANGSQGIFFPRVNGRQPHKPSGATQPAHDDDSPL